MIYKAIFTQEGTSDYFENDELLFTAKTKVHFLNLSSITYLYDNNDISIFAFSEFAFTALFWKLKILNQKLEKKVLIKKKKLEYVLIVDTQVLSLKFTKNPFSYLIANMYLDEKLIGEIRKEYKNSCTIFNFNFSHEFGMEYYFLILFSMSSTGITGDD